MELSTADPVPTSVRFYLAALLSYSAGREICRCFSFFSPPTNRCIKLSRAKRQTDGSVRCMKRKMFCSVPSCAFGGRDVFSAKCLNKVAVFFGKTSHPLCFRLHGRNWVTWSRSGTEKQTFQICDVWHNWNTQTERLKIACMLLFNKSSDLMQPNPSEPFKIIIIFSSDYQILNYFHIYSEWSLSCLCTN